MAERFNLTAQLQLQAPTNTRQVVNQIRGQLKGLTAQVNVQANAKSLNQVNAGLQTTSKQAATAARSVGVLNKNLSEAARRFGVITLATGTMLSFAQAVKRGVAEAVAFERELVKISQVTGKSVRELQGLTNEITRLATGLGVSSSSLLETSRVLAQAGFSAKQTKQALDILAKTTLGPTFDDVTQTVEGAIAVLRQFSAEAARSGGQIKFLESTLDAINAVSKSFAVESSDLISVIRRVGGVFSSAGGSVNELIALFTSVRATTRESAETIATGLRTIFTRIQRTDTVDQLRALGIQLRDAEGNFVGAFEAVRRLSTGLSSLDPRSAVFSEIVESLGGFRQIGKVIPLIQQFTVAQDALNVAQNAAGSVAQDAVTAQQSLAVQATKVREEFASLLRTLADSETFRGIASAALQLASALIRIGEALEPVLPLLTSFLALKVGQGLAPGLAAIFGGGRRRGLASGGVVHKFARGGYVPGSGNRDTVPAMLQPGEFVIKKSSAGKLGPDTLHAMNNNRFQTGGLSGEKQQRLKAVQRKAAGGTIDTVPALLTPGEFVVNKSAAQSIGYSNLHKMNQTGVARYNAGGVVGGVQRFQAGGAVAAGGAPPFIPPNNDAINKALKAYTAVIYKQVRATNQSLTAQQALNLTRIKVNSRLKAVATQQKTYIQHLKETSTTLQLLSKASARVKENAKSLSLSGVKGAAKQAFGSKEGREAFTGRLDSIAGAAQQFAFLAAAAASVGAQFSGLDEATQTAISQTAAFAASTLGIVGTITQLITSMTASIASSAGSAAADVAESAASGVSAAADTAEAAASSAAAVSAGLFATTIGLVVIAIVAAIAAVKFFAYRAEAAAKNLDKLADAELDKLREGEGGSGEQFARLQQQAIMKRTEAQTYDASLTSGEAIGGALAGAGIGAAIGTLIAPGIGTAIGAAIGAGLGYFGGALFDYGQNIEAAKAEQEALMARVRETGEALVGTIKASREFDQALSDIDIEKNLEPEERVKRRISAQRGRDVGAELSRSTVATDALFRLAQEANKSIGELTEADFEDNAGKLAEFKNATAEASESMQGLQAAVAASRQTLQEAASIELTGERSFDEVLASGGQLAQALELSQAAIKAEARARIRSLERELKTAPPEAKEEIRGDIKGVQDRLKQQLNDQVGGLKKQSGAAEKRREADLRAAAAAEAVRRELLQIRSFTNTLVAAEEAIKKTEQSLNNLSSYLDGGALDFSTQAPAGLDDLSQVGNRRDFESRVRGIGATGGEEGARLAEKIIKGSRAIGVAETQFAGKTEKELSAEFMVDKVEKITSTMLLSALGLDKVDIGGEAVFAEFDAKFREFIEGGLSAEEMKELTDLITANLGESQEALKKLNDLNNQYIQQQQQFLDMLQGQRDKELAARQKLTDTLLRGAELRAQARGQQLSPAQKEAFRTRSAQQALQGITDPRGRQVKAGNVEQVQAARMAADAKRFTIQLKLAGKEALGAGETMEGLASEERRLANVVAKTSAEIDRLGDQSAASSDIMSEIDKERAKRERVTGVIEDFVLGGNEERQSINKAFAGIQNAIATGSFQGQSPEQRKATAQMLDTLGDVQVTGGFVSAISGERKTGRAEEVKQEIIFRDAIRMGLDPKIAKKLATATSKEQQLITALKDLTDATRDAANANVEFEKARTDRLETQAPSGTVVPERAAPISAKPPTTQEERLAERKAENERKREERRRARLGLPAPAPVVPAAAAAGPATQPTDAERQRIGLPVATPAGAMPFGDPNAGFQAVEDKERGIRRQITAEERQRRLMEQESAPFGGRPQGQQIAAPAATAGAIAPAGAMALDTTVLQGTLDNFLGNFSGVFDNIVSSFSGIQNALTGLAQSMTGFTMQHNVTVEGLISIGGLNLESIKQELSTTIGQMVAADVERITNEKIAQLPNRAT